MSNRDYWRKRGAHFCTPLHSYKEPTVFLMVLVYPLNVGNSHDRSVVLISGVCFTESLILVDVKEHIIKTLMCKVLAPHKFNIESQNTLAVHTRISLIIVLNMFFELVLCLTLFLFDVGDLIQHLTVDCSANLLC